MVILQFILAVGLVGLSYGPLGHHILSWGGGLDLLLLSVWIFSWLTDEKTAYRWAIILGLAADSLSFFPFGLWLVSFSFLTGVLLWLKGKYLDVSSFIHALISLLIANLLIDGIYLLIAGRLQPSAALLGITANLLLGSFLYYVLAVRYKLFHQWGGKRL